MNYMKPHALAGIHAITGHPFRRNSSNWCERPLLADDWLFERVAP
jgi:hypothetical protein